MKKFLSSILVVATLATPVSMMTAFADEPTEAKEVASNFVLDENNETSKVELKKIETQKNVNKLLKDAEKNGAVLNVYDKEGKLVESLDIKKKKANKQIGRIIKTVFAALTIFVESIMVRYHAGESIEELIKAELKGANKGSIWWELLLTESPTYYYLEAFKHVGIIVIGTVLNGMVTFALPSAIINKLTLNN